MERFHNTSIILIQDGGIVQSVSNDEMIELRETGWSLSAAGVLHLRGVGLSKKLLLSAVMRIANSANNGETPFFFL